MITFRLVERCFYLIAAGFRRNLCICAICSLLLGINKGLRPTTVIGTSGKCITSHTERNPSYLSYLMATRNEQKWQANFNKLKAYIEEHGQLPDKKKEPERNLLNWWKYNKRLIKQGKMDAERYVKLMMLSNMRVRHL